MNWLSAPEHQLKERGYWGGSIQRITPELAESLGAGGIHGVLISSIRPGSPAERANFHLADMVTSVNGRGVDSPMDLTAQVISSVPGATVRFDIVRSGRRVSIDTVMGPYLLTAKQNFHPDPRNPVSGLRELPGSRCPEVLGMTLSALDSASPTMPEAPQGGALVLAVRPSSDAARKGLKPDDVIFHIGADPVKSCSDVVTMVSNARLATRSSVPLGVWRGGVTVFVPVRTD